jgi:Tfp pilus assembly protein PilO
MTLSSKSKWQWFLLLIIPLLLVVSYVYAVKPVKEERAEAQKELQSKRKELHTLQTKLEGNQTSGSKDRVMLDQVRAGVPEAPYVEELIRDFRMLEAVSGLKMDSYNIQVSQEVAAGTSNAGQPQQPAWSTLALPIKMTATVKGGYPQIYRLLNELKTLRRIIHVENIHFTTPTSYPVKLHFPNQEISSTITFVAYYAPGLSRFYKQPIPTDYARPEGKPSPM